MFIHPLQIEKHVEKMAVRTQKVLVLVHREDGPPPSGTVRWLNMRSWCQSHHHIRARKRMFVKRTPAKIVGIIDFQKWEELESTVA